MGLDAFLSFLSRQKRKKEIATHVQERRRVARDFRLEPFEQLRFADVTLWPLGAD